jgi:hypothetical protein
MAAAVDLDHPHMIAASCSGPGLPVHRIARVLGVGFSRFAQIEEDAQSARPTR